MLFNPKDLAKWDAMCWNQKSNYTPFLFT